jgi:hypothetical protein
MRKMTMKIMAAALLTLAVLAGLSQLPAQAASAHTRITWDSNRSTWDDFNRAIPLANAVRIWYDHPNVFPSKLPVGAGAGVWEAVSIRPTPWMLFHHRLDAKIRALAASAPPHSELTIWHDNGPANPMGYPPSVNNAATAVRMQEYVQNLVKGTRVRFGVIICAWRAW